MIKNWDRQSMRIASARYLDRPGMLDVTFENGDHFLVAVESVVPSAARARRSPPASPVANGATPVARPDWSRMRIGETGDVLEVPASRSIIEIPWDRIRSVADAKFRAHLAEWAAEQARRIGELIRAMRLNAGLTQVALAKKVGMPRQTISDLEAGRIEPQTDRIEQIAIALGRSLRDFAQE